MPTPFQILADSGVPLLIVGGHAVNALGGSGDTAELECAIAATNETKLAHYVGLTGWNMVYRTQFFAKYRLFSTGSPEIKMMFLDDTTFARMLAAGSDRAFEKVTLRVPSLIHLIAMKLQVVKNEPHLEIDELPQIVALLRANSGRWKPEELAAACERFGPPEIGERIGERLAM